VVRVERQKAIPSPISDERNSTCPSNLSDRGDSIARRRYGAIGKLGIDVCARSQYTIKGEESPRGQGLWYRATWDWPDICSRFNIYAWLTQILEHINMNLHIRPVRNTDVEDLVRLSLLAWAPVFSSFEQVLGHNIYTLIWPDWRTSQRDGIETVCKDGGKTIVWVAELDGMVVGFLAYQLNIQDKTGEVQLLAVHPEYQNLGIGTELNIFALKQMKESGMIMARVETGGDPSHAPARRSYEKAGYTGLPLVRYYKDL